MTDAPERLWISDDKLIGWTANPREALLGDIEYTRTDLIPALEAAAYARGPHLTSMKQGAYECSAVHQRERGRT